jgi:hypothetical protein
LEVGDTKLFPVELLKVGNEMEFQCLNTNTPVDDPVLICEIMVKYESVKSFLSITGDVNAGKPLIEKVINQILTAIDARIRANQ